MAASKFWRPDFDQAATFIVAAWPAGFTVRGVQPKRGAIFDKNSVPVNMLRAHYHDRWLDMVPAENVVPIKAEPPPAELPAQLDLAEVDAEQDEEAVKKPKRSRAGSKLV